MSSPQSAHSGVTARRKKTTNKFMITAIDTSVLMTIARQGERWERWAKALTKAANEGPLVVCCVVFGEFSQGYRKPEMALQHLHSLHIHYDPIQPLTAQMAYRDSMRSRKEPHMLPYHLIGAHASFQADRLAVDSMGDPRQFFPMADMLFC